MSKRVIVVTGATRGLGAALCARFAEAGHRVAGCGRDEARVVALREKHGGPHVFQRVDVADDGAVRSWAASVLNTMGPPDLLLNNAALMNRTAELWKLSADEFDPVIDVNIKGVANVIRHFVPAMVARGTGAVVNFSSGWGRSTSPHVAPYCATKWAMEGLTQSLSQELPAGMAAVALNPGIINTDMLQSCWAEGADGYPTAEPWSHQAAAFLLKLNATHNGKALSVK